MIEDRQLLEFYVNKASETAFAELVGRHVNLVYSTALRRMNGDAQLAQDVAQLVFTDLARKARILPQNIALAGWLHRATRYAAAQMMRSERRRHLREQEAVNMITAESDPGVDWEQIRPLLDAALDRLNQTDRAALILRFFEQRSLSEVGRALGANEDAARKRVNRALEKLRAGLIRRGIITTSATLAAAISVNAMPAAPAGLAASFTATALAGAGAATGITFTALKIMSLTKLQAAVAGAVIVAGIATPLVIQHHYHLQTENAALHQQLEEMTGLKAENRRLTDELAQAANVRSSNADTGELLRLRGEIAHLRSRSAGRAEGEPATEPTGTRQAKLPPQTGGADFANQLDGPTVPLAAVNTWTNVGNATPGAAFQTVISAAVNRDPETFARCVVWDPDVKNRMETLFAAAPESVQNQFGSVDGVLYAIASGNSLGSRLTNIGMVSENINGEDGTLTEQHQYVNGTTWQNTWPVHRFPDGWRVYLMGHPKVLNAFTALLSNPAAANPPGAN